MAFDYDKYIRPGKLPHIWCPGCGHGIVMKGLIRAIDTLKLEKDKTCIVSGIGCASRLPGYMDCCTLHTAHGRAAAFATGIKMARPEMINPPLITGFLLPIQSIKAPKRGRQNTPDKDIRP